MLHRGQVYNSGLSYHPDDDFAAYELYAIAEAANITVASGKADEWAWTGSLSHIFKQGDSASRPTITASGALGKECLTFDGTNDRMAARDSGDTGDRTIADFMDTGGVCTMFVVVYVTGVANNAINPYENDAIITDDNGGTWGLMLRNSATPIYRPWGWDGNADSISGLEIATGTGYILTYRKPDTDAMYGSLNGGAESSVANGSIATTANFDIGDSGLAAPFNGELYMVAGTKTALSAGAAATIAASLKSYYRI